MTQNNAGRDAHGIVDDQKNTCERNEPGGGILRRVIATTEGRVLLAGLALLIIYLACIGLTKHYSDYMFTRLWTMTVTHVLGGRASGISWGYAHGLENWLVILVNIVIESIIVLIVYPLFVFSYHRLIVIRPLEDTMRRIQHGARQHQGTVMKWGIPGLLLFVFFPFWMTGPVIGSVIGFLIGLKTWINLTVVLAGTSLAVVCWGLILERIYVALKSLGYYVPFMFVGLVLLVAISIHIRYAFTSRSRGNYDQKQRRD